MLAQPAMMKTWIGPSWTGSVEFATPMQVSVSSAIALLPGTMPRHLLWASVDWQRALQIELGSSGNALQGSNWGPRGC